MNKYKLFAFGLAMTAGLSSLNTYAAEGDATPYLINKTGTASSCSSAGGGCTWTWWGNVGCTTPPQTFCMAGYFYLGITSSTCVSDPTGGGGYLCK
jgi:hypothetical protein